MKTLMVANVLNELVTENKNKDLVVKMPLRFSTTNEFNMLLKNTERTYQLGLICIGFLSSSLLYSKIDVRAATIGKMHKGHPQDFIVDITNHLKALESTDRTTILSNLLAGLSTYDNLNELEVHIVKRLENLTKDLSSLYDVCDSILGCPEYKLIDTEEIDNPAFLSQVIINKLHKLILTDYMNAKNKLSVYTTTVFVTRVGFQVGSLVKDDSKIGELFVMKMILLLTAIKQSSIIFRGRLTEE